MEAEQARTQSEAEHRKTAANYNSCISHMRQLEKKLKRSINKSRSVFCASIMIVEMTSPCLGLLICERVCVGEIGAPFKSSDAVQMFHVLVVQCWGVLPL